ncbi:MAG: hypothetical protein RIQ79_2556 [Verrucomicrobiota bacterium]
MGEHMQDVNAATIVVDGGDETVGVREVENGDGATAGYFDLVGVGKGAARLDKVCPRGPAGNGVPMEDGRRGFGMLEAGGVTA